jgi:hypothetical protein
VFVNFPSRYVDGIDGLAIWMTWWDRLCLRLPVIFRLCTRTADGDPAGEAAVSQWWQILGPQRE